MFKNFYTAGAEMPTSTGDLLRRWKEYFEVPLNPADLSSVGKAEVQDSGSGLLTTQAEVAVAVKKLHSGKARGLEISALST